SAWPDACALLPAGAAARLAGVPYTASPRMAPADFALPRAVSCLLEPVRAGGVPISVSVAWVFRSADGARELFSSYVGGELQGAVEGLGDEAYHFDDTFKDALLIRVGPVVVTVDAFGDAALAARASRQVARDLRRFVESAG
ncbi:hypothetical protein, partial [Nonomuraea lactucae]|uniref:hypothetical protein n=1 Tax=Nonomuraea lactucae TaxID=2249762 RepID=UPI0013B475A8